MPHDPNEGSASYPLPASALLSFNLEMLVLFSIAMVCFFALFGMLVILLRQAKSEGALKSSRRESMVPRARVADTRGSFGASQAGLHLNLSNLVPGKQPDWRFMVREGGTTQQTHPFRRKGPESAGSTMSRADRALSHKDSGDLTDPQTSTFARRA